MEREREMWDFASCVDPRHNTPMSTQKEQFPLKPPGFWQVLLFWRMNSYELRFQTRRKKFRGAAEIAIRCGLSEMHLLKSAAPNSGLDGETLNCCDTCWWWMAFCVRGTISRWQATLDELKHHCEKQGQQMCFNYLTWGWTFLQKIWGTWLCTSDLM